MVSNFCSSYPNQLIFCLVLPYREGGGRQAVDKSYRTKSCSHYKSVYCSQVTLEINSQQQHQQKALTDCLMC